MHQPFEIVVLGTASATPTRDRNPSSHYVRFGNNHILIDCGEGTQNQLLKYGLKMHKIRTILITHLHGDHYFGLPGLLFSMALNNRQEPLTLVGPSDLKKFIEDILAHGHVPEAIYLQMEAYTRALFARGTQMAKDRGLILVDTKYEFGLKDGQVILIDEIHTPDSSRYFYADGYEERQRNGEPQKQLSKEFVRQWLIEQGFQGLEGQQMPVMPDDFVELVSQRYIELYEKITGEAFIKDAQEDMIARINNKVSQYLMA
jgi:ribonuclease BN (tRNA processing enzyme)